MRTMRTTYLPVSLVILSLVSIFVGVSPITPLDLFHLSDVQAQILTISRIPRLVSIVVAGAGMSVAGLIMQQLTRNKFVSPTTAGTMDSARLGVLVSLLVFPAAGMLQKIVVALAFTLLGTFAFMHMLKRIRFKDTIFIPLVGLMFGNIVSAVTTFVAYKYNLIQNVSAWLHGDFSMILRGRYEFLYVSIPLICLAYLYANRFTIAGMGEAFSANLGLKHDHVVRVGLVIVAAVSATVVLTVGTLPFLGLIVPNIVSIYRGDHLKKSLVDTAFLGAIFVLVCDVFGRVVIFPYEVSVGLIMGVLGSCTFLYLLFRGRAHG